MSVFKECKACNQTKSELDFWRSTKTCRTCHMKPVLQARADKRIPKKYGMNAGDKVSCETCKNEFTLSKTLTKVPKFCSKNCRRPPKSATLLGLELMKNLTQEQKERRSKKMSLTMAGRAGRGRSAKGVRNHRAKFYELKGPDQKIYSFKNLAHFVRSNKHLFTELELKEYSNGSTQAEQCLRGLFSINKQGEIKRLFWHGWTIGDKSEKSLKNQKRVRDECGKFKKAAA